jgi:hypothetical protein
MFDYFIEISKFLYNNLNHYNLVNFSKETKQGFNLIDQ